MFAIVSNNKLLYSHVLSNFSGSREQRDSYYMQFILYASLDSLKAKESERKAKESRSNPRYIGEIERFDSYTVSAYVTAGRAYFLLLLPSDFETKNSKAKEAFFVEIYKIYSDLLMNPFYTVNETIEDELFKERVEEIKKDRLINKN